MKEERKIIIAQDAKSQIIFMNKNLRMQLSKIIYFKLKRKTYQNPGQF